MNLLEKIKKKMERRNSFVWGDINPLYFNALIQDKNIRKCIFYGEFRNELIPMYFDYVSKRKDSCKIYITGEPGTGKSMLALELAHRLRDLEGKESKVHLVYGMEEFIMAVSDFEEVKSGDVIVIDEMPIVQGEGSRKLVWEMTNILNSIRREKLHMIFCSVRIMHESGIRPFAELKIAGRDSNKKRTLFLIYLMGKLVGKAYVTIRDIEYYTKFEDEKKSEYINKIRLSGGKVFRNGIKKVEEKVMSLDFKSSNIRDFILDNCDDSRVKFALSKLFSGVRQRYIAEELNMSQGKLSELITKFGESKLGMIAEKYFQHLFGDKRDFGMRVPQGEPDVIGEDGSVYGVKCYLGHKKSQAFNYLEDFWPEINYCNENDLDGFYIIFCNPLWEDGYRKFFVKLKEMKNGISFFKNKNPKTY